MRMINCKKCNNGGSCTTEHGNRRNSEKLCISWHMEIWILADMENFIFWPMSTRYFEIIGTEIENHTPWNPLDIRDRILSFNLASLDSQFSMYVNIYIGYVKIFNENVLRQGRSSKKFWNYFFKDIILGIISMPFSLILHSWWLRKVH